MSRVWSATKSGRALRLRVVESAAPAAGRAAGWDEGHAHGIAEGRRTVEAELASERAALARLADGLEAIAAPDVAALASLLGAAAARLAVAAAGETGIDRDLLQTRAHAVIAALADMPGPIRLRLHPDDSDLLADVREAELVADAAVARGSVRAEAGDAWCADGVGEACARILAEAGL